VNEQVRDAVPEQGVSRQAPTATEYSSVRSTALVYTRQWLSLNTSADADATSVRDYFSTDLTIDVPSIVNHCSHVA